MPKLSWLASFAIGRSEAPLQAPPRWPFRGQSYQCYTMLYILNVSVCMWCDTDQWVEFRYLRWSQESFFSMVWQIESQSQWGAQMVHRWFTRSLQTKRKNSVDSILLKFSTDLTLDIWSKSSASQSQSLCPTWKLTFKSRCYRYKMYEDTSPGALRPISSNKRILRYLESLHSTVL